MILNNVNNKINNIKIIFKYIKFKQAEYRNP